MTFLRVLYWDYRSPSCFPLSCRSTVCKESGWDGLKGWSILMSLPHHLSLTSASTAIPFCPATLLKLFPISQSYSSLRFSSHRTSVMSSETGLLFWIPYTALCPSLVLPEGCKELSGVLCTSLVPLRCWLGHQWNTTLRRSGVRGWSWHPRARAWRMGAVKWNLQMNKGL